MKFNPENFGFFKKEGKNFRWELATIFVPGALCLVPCGFICCILILIKLRLKYNLMRIALSLIAIYWYTSLHAQDSCFTQRRMDAMDVYLDSADVREDKIERYVSSFLGCTAPSFQAVTIAGEPVSSEKLKGKVVVLNFWFTQCKPCVAEMPALNKLAREFAAQDVEFIAIALDTKEKIQAFLLAHPFDYKIIAEGRELSALFRIMPYPTNIVLDREYKVAAILHNGPANAEEELENYEKLKPVVVAALKKR